ncbi:hypothetical protein GCM10010439_57890 [Actinocorallia aurantiaca]|uniref:Uncharacterized protein n=1 Tax=Actinocorallia aurantiaca TaxID=46204 RepID=A0ABN3UMQ9_9ACTN
MPRTCREEPSSAGPTFGHSASARDRPICARGSTEALGTGAVSAPPLAHPVTRTSPVSPATALSALRILRRLPFPGRDRAVTRFLSWPPSPAGRPGPAERLADGGAAFYYDLALKASAARARLPEQTRRA